MIPIVEPPCPFCGASERRPVVGALRDIEDGVPGVYGICSCRHCEALYLSPAPDPGALGRCYRERYYARTDRTGTLVRRLLYGTRAELRYRGLRPALPASGSLLEIGCGDAGFLAHLERRTGPGLRLTGMDLDVSRVALPPGSRIRLISGEIERVDFAERFDAALMFDVLEHLADPIGALRRVAALLAPSGILIGTVPDWASPWRKRFPAHWSGLQVPRHQTFYTVARLEQALRNGGFTELAIRRTYDPGDISVTVSNWLADRLRLRTRPREAWFYLPVTVLAAPIALLGLLGLGTPGALTFVARRAAGEAKSGR